MRVRRLSAAGVIAASLSLIAAPAFAAPVAVEVGGSTAATNSAFTATANGATLLSVGGNTMICLNATLGGTVHGGAAKDPFADITAGTWGACTFYNPTFGFLAASMSATNWQLSATAGYTNGTSAVVSVGTTGALSLNVTTPCIFNLNGSIAATFTEQTSSGAQRIDVGTSSLAVANSNIACLGIVNNADAAAFSGALSFDTDVTGVAYPEINMKP